MQREMKSSRAEVQDLQGEIQVLETTQESLERVQKEYQELRTEKEQLLEKVEELEEQQKILLEANTLHTQELRKEHQEQVSSLKNALEEEREQQVNLQPFKEHVLAQKTKMLQLQTAVEDERCRVLQIDGRLEEILETASYFVDRSQDVLEVLTARMARLENNEETPAELPSKDKQALKRAYDLVEFAINNAEDFKKAVKKTKGLCTDFFRRLLIT